MLCKWYENIQISFLKNSFQSPCFHWETEEYVVRMLSDWVIIARFRLDLTSQYKTWIPFRNSMNFNSSTVISKSLLSYLRNGSNVVVFLCNFWLVWSSLRGELIISHISFPSTKTSMRDELWAAPIERKKSCPSEHLNETRRPCWYYSAQIFLSKLTNIILYIMSCIPYMTEGPLYGHPTKYFILYHSFNPNSW